MPEKISQWFSFIGTYAAEKGLPAIIVLVVGIFSIRILNTIVNRFLESSTLEKAAHSLIRSLVRVALYVLLGLTVASTLAIDVTGLIALASVLTLAISLAIQNALTNIIGGFTLLYNHPFHSGDYVDIGDESGTVTEVGMTYTQLQTPDNKLISIPNATVVAGNIVNYSATGTRRVEIPVQVEYSVPTQKVIDALIQAGTVDNVLLDPAPMAVLTSYGDSGINYSLRVWVKTGDYWDTIFTINQNIMSIFNAQGISMAYPHMNVHIEQ